MPLAPFLDALDARVLVCDGAMGTMLYAKGIFLNRSFDELNLTQPDLVAEVHQAYVRAGSDIIETNTFGANRIKLGAFSLADRAHAINVQGARIARHAAREQAYVAGAIGPLGIRIEPWGKTGVDEAEEYFCEQAKALVEGGVQLFILETFRDLNEITAAIRAVRSVCQLPIVAQMTTEDDGNSLDGTPPEQFAPALEAAGADVVGLNCSVGPAAMLETIERMSRATNARLSAQPNAGKPRDVEGRNIYLCSPEYMASYARRFILNGVKIVGGCCGTTPDHIRQIKAAVRALTPPQPRVVAERVQAEVAEARPVDRDSKSRMANALARRNFVVSVELLPPRGHRTDALVDQARTLKIHGVDIVNVPDGPRASARMSALAMAVLVQQQAGLEPILHYACRDRNLLGMQSDLLGAHAMGVRNLLIVTGDPPKAGDYPDATAVFDVDSIGLTNVVSRLNRGLDIGGQAIGAATAFHIGVALNPAAPNLDEEIRRFEYKVEAGAEFAVTQPIYDVAAFERVLKRIEHVRIPIVAGLAPLESVRHAEFLANEVPGVHVPDALLDRMRRAEAAGRAPAEGLAMAREIASALRGVVEGLQITTGTATGNPLPAVLGVLEVCTP
ncbi:MAG TPA: bifunctional homocysteine S-methyltransferase/methylenetetrahydrofolate reductase [Vicinamibacterales bacterium]|jgi:homocysteine S-methyltransferase|nr:bifunctional homocysteine S-methyltransferase/methylenetetrahydrofolate reductase [Vicinamibacterales bacterium]